MAKEENSGRPTGPVMPRLAGPVLIAVAATMATVATLAPEGGGPGVTCDEGYHVATGKRLVMALRQQGLGFFKPANVAENFYWPPGGMPVSSLSVGAGASRNAGLGRAPGASPAGVPPWSGRWR